MRYPNLPLALRAIAKTSHAREYCHDIVLKNAADELEQYDAKLLEVQKALELFKLLRQISELLKE